MALGLAVAYRELRRYGSRMLDNALVVFDSSALLRLYECSSLERDSLLDALGSVRDRLWIPNRVYIEVHRRRDDVRGRNRNAIRVVGPSFAKMFGKVQNRRDINKAYDVPLIFARVLAEAESIVENMLVAEMTVTENTAFGRVDKLINRLMELGRQAPVLDNEDFERLLRIGPNRMKGGVPPGYEDFEKKLAQGRRLEDALGDLILWEEMIRFAGNARRPILFITGEEKCDWWERSTTDLRPHALLVAEMLNRSQQKYASLRVQDFVDLVSYRAEAKLLLETERTMTSITTYFAAPEIGEALRASAEPLTRLFASMDMQTIGASPAATELAKMLATYQRQLGAQDSISKYLASTGLTTSRLHELLSAAGKSVFPSILDMQTIGASPAATEYAKMLATYQRQLGSQDSISRYLASTGLTTSRLHELLSAASKSVFPSILDMQTIGASSAATELAKRLATYQRQLGSRASDSRYLASIGVTGDTLQRVYERVASSQPVEVPLPKVAKRKRSKRNPKKLTKSSASNDAKP